mgnify:CR=1 FL=1
MRRPSMPPPRGWLLLHPCAPSQSPQPPATNSISCLLQLVLPVRRVRRRWMPSTRTAPSPSALALLGRPRPFAWSLGTCCSTPAPAGGRRLPRRLWRFAPANPGLLACSAGLCRPGLAVNKQQAGWGIFWESSLFCSSYQCMMKMKLNLNWKIVYQRICRGLCICITYCWFGRECILISISFHFVEKEEEDIFHCKFQHPVFQLDWINSRNWNNHRLDHRLWLQTTRLQSQLEKVPLLYPILFFWSFWHVFIYFVVSLSIEFKFEIIGTIEPYLR